MVKIFLSVVASFVFFSAFSQSTINKDSLDYYYLVGDYNKALFFAEKNLTETKLQKKSADYYSLALYDLGIINTDMGNYDTALVFYNQAKKIQEELQLTQKSIYANTLTGLGNLYALTARYKEAEQALNASKNIFTTLALKDNDYAELLNTYGYLYQVTGKFNESIEYFKASLSIREKLLGKYHTKYILVLGNLGVTYFTIGDYVTAENTYLEALSLIKKSSQPNMADLAYNLSYISSIYLRLGNTNSAYPYVKESIELMRKTVGESSPDFAASLNNLGHCSLGLGKVSEADSLYKESIKAIQKSVGNQHQAYAAKLTNYAVFALALINVDTALNYFNKALQIVRQNSGEESNAYAWAVRYVGKAFYKKEMYDTAKILYAKALTIFEKVLGKKHPDYINLAGFYIDAKYASKDYDKLASFIPNIMEIQNQHLLNKLDFLNLSDLINYLRSAEYILEISFPYISKLNQHPMVTQTFNQSLLLKGLSVANHSNLVKYFEESVQDSVLIKKWLLYKSSKQQINKLTTQPKSNNPNILDSLEQTVYLLEKDLLKSSQQFRNIKDKLQINWEKIKLKLKANEVGLEFVEYNVNNYKDFTTHYGVFILRSKDSIPIFIELANKSQLVTSLSRYNYKTQSVIKSLSISKEVSKPIYNLIWKPIEKYLTGYNTIYFSPDGLLHQIAFAAMPNESKDLLIDRYKLIQLSSTREIVDSEYNDKAIENVLLFGGINYNEATIDSLTQANKDAYKYVYQQNKRGLADSFRYLPGTLAEVVNIEKKLKANGTNTITYTKKIASEYSFRRACAQIKPQIIHIATHGFALPNTTTSLAVNTAFTTSQNPLLRTGLIMAGGNKGWKGITNYNEDDGVLTGMEIANMPLTYAQLVVLSACETANGEIKGSEGVFSLQRAFKLAGAKYIMASLWQVPDEQTKEFMTIFYTNYTENKNIQDAFYNTQLSMKKKYSPFYWAAFKLIK